MDPLQILEGLNKEAGFPTEAIQAAQADKDSIIPLFVRTFEETVSSGDTRYGPALFFVFHLLGEWRAKSAYPVLARFLRKSPELVGAILGDAITTTAHRVIAAIAVLTLRGELPRSWTEQFMRECYDRLQPPEYCYVWSGWQQSIAWLGIAGLKPLVEQAFARGSIDNMWLSFKDFEEGLQYTLDHPDAPPLHPNGDLSLFDDTIGELSKWAAFNPEPRPKKQPAPVSFYHPERNPFRNVGRNDPCPCGSGKKFKKCCLDAN